MPHNMLGKPGEVALLVNNGWQAVGVILGAELEAPPEHCRPCRHTGLYRMRS